MIRYSKLLFWGLSMMVFLTIYCSCGSSELIDYSTDVKPIINNKCIKCHGGVKKQGGFSLLFESEAKAQLESGKYAIVPGSPERSEMIIRLNMSDPDMRMPFEEDPLTREEIEILTKWIDQGAEWGRHWAYEAVEKPLMEADNIGHDIDLYIQDKMDDLSLTLSPRADPSTIVRRLGLDIIGMPVLSDLSKTYLSDPSNSNYELLVDSLLNSKHYGEKWTSMWLDLARYADTKGYERDPERKIWRYRDWVIRAFNEDMPYDQFITEQLAGDLLPDPTDDQYLATAFHRNTMTNDEGGTDNEEFRTAAIIDRVNTTWEAVMGTSFACVQCHSHPYDPFTHEEYYKFYAFFNNTRDEDTEEDYPLLRHYDTGQLTKMDQVLSWVENHGDTDDRADVKRFIKTLAPARPSLTTDQFVNGELADTKWLALRNNSSARLKDQDLNDRNRILLRYRPLVAGGQFTFHIDDANGEQIAELTINPHLNDRKWQIVELPIKSYTGSRDIYISYSNSGIKDPNRKCVMFDWFYFKKELPGIKELGFDSIKAHFFDLIESNVPTTPVMVENPKDLHRTTQVFARGNFLVKTTEVSASTPSVFPPMTGDLPMDRLGLANWMMSPDHPLPARTIVNRVWAQLFGRGIVETLEDIGTQGEQPTHQELLDYLSWQLVHKYDWSLKMLIKEIVLSDTYRQSSQTTEDHMQADPLNIYLAHMPRIRLSAEQIRDQALFVSHSLNDELYGPPVMPYQPEGVWQAPYDNTSWIQGEGGEIYRRALYTFWKRTSPYPSAMTFDGVGRERCVSRRINTNTPLQALVTLNDSVYIDIARRMTQHVWDESLNDETMIVELLEAVTQQKATQDKKQILLNLYRDAKEQYSMDLSMAKKLCGTEVRDPARFAAMILVSNTILNLDEVIMKS